MRDYRIDTRGIAIFVLHAALEKGRIRGEGGIEDGTIVERFRLIQPYRSLCLEMEEGGIRRREDSAHSFVTYRSNS